MVSIKKFLFEKALTTLPVYLKLIDDGIKEEVLFWATGGNTFQNLNVSSDAPAPVTMVSPSGDKVRYRTLLVCPSRMLTFDSSGYFQMTI